MVLEDHGKDALPRPGDFVLSFYLPGDPGDPHARELPFPGREKTFLAEPFPCLTDDAVLDVVGSLAAADPLEGDPDPRPVFGVGQLQELL